MYLHIVDWSDKPTYTWRRVHRGTEKMSTGGLMCAISLNNTFKRGYISGITSHFLTNSVAVLSMLNSWL